MPPLQDIVFIGLSTMVLLAGFMAVWKKNVFHNALYLIVALFGVAGLFIFLNSEFLAVMEIIIYIGAISIAIIFAIMLSSPMSRDEKVSIGKSLRSFVIAAFLFAALLKTIFSSRWPEAVIEGDYSLQAIGKNLLTTSVLPFEAVSLVLLIAIIGALMISSGSKES